MRSRKKLLTSLPKLNNSLLIIASVSIILNFGILLSGVFVVSDPHANDRVSHVSPIRVNESDDIIYLLSELSNFDRTHNLYTKIAEVAPNATIALPGKERTTARGNAFRARLLGLGKVDKIREHGYSFETVIKDDGYLENKVSRGEVYRWPGHEEPEARWLIALDDTTPKEDKQLILVKNPEDSQFIFIERTLTTDDFEDKIEW